MRRRVVADITHDANNLPENRWPFASLRAKVNPTPPPAFGPPSEEFLKKNETLATKLRRQAVLKQRAVGAVQVESSWNHSLKAPGFQTFHLKCDHLVFQSLLYQMGQLVPLHRGGALRGQERARGARRGGAPPRRLPPRRRVGAGAEQAGGEQGSRRHG